MILKESQIDPDTIRKVVGEPYKENGRLLTATGSSFFFVRKLANHDDESILRWEDSKAIFQRHTNGLALYVNRSNYQRVILIKSESIREIRLIRYLREHQPAGTFLPFISGSIKKITLGLIRIPTTISHKETVLEIATDEYNGSFYTSYSSFNEQRQYFSKLGLGERFITVD